MNVLRQIQDVIRDLEIGQNALSLIISRCLRIATFINDFEAKVWLKRELTDCSSKEKVQQFYDDINKELVKLGVQPLEAKQIVQKDVIGYANRRTVNVLKGTSISEGIFCMSISDIENRIEIIKAQMDKNIIPEGLHSVDLYFKDEEKKSIDLHLLNSLENFENILKKTRSKVYEYLVEIESKYLNNSESEEKINMLNKNVFIIHGHNEAKWRELEKILREDFKLNPVILNSCPDKGLTLIEKFEYYANTCSYAFAIFTPDDIVENSGSTYFQARPNVIFELGWFCAQIGRSKVCLIVQDDKIKNMNIFSDFQGITQKRFYKSIKEIYRDIDFELKDAGIL